MWVIYKLCECSSNGVHILHSVLWPLLQACTSGLEKLGFAAVVMPDASATSAEPDVHYIDTKKTWHAGLWLGAHPQRVTYPAGWCLLP